MKRILLLAIFIIQNIFFCTARDVAWSQYTSQTGLPSNMIYDIYRDYDGYLWFATDKGIAKYNGVYFETFSTIHGLPSNEIFFFKQDFQRRLWISAVNGELCYYKEGKFYTAANAPFLTLPFQAYDIKFITVHADSSITMFFLNQADYCINIKNEKLKVIDIRKLNLIDKNVSSIVKPAPGIYEIFAGKEKISINENAFVLRNEPLQIAGKTYMASYTQDSIYLFDSKGIYDQRQRLLSRFRGERPEDLIRVYIKNGMLALGTNKGLVLDGKLLLEGKKVSSVTQDMNGNLWIGTLGQGVFKLKNNYKQRALHTAVYQGRVSCSRKTKEGILFATTTGMLYQLANVDGDSVALIDSLRTPSESVQYLDDSFFYAYDGQWLRVSAHRQGEKSHKIYNADLNPLGPKALIVSGSLAYIHTRTSIACVKYKTGEWISKPQRSVSRIFCMDKDADGQIWYTTKDMYRLSGATNVKQPGFSRFSFKWFKFFDDVFLGITHSGQLAVARIAESNNVKYKVVQSECKWTDAYGIDSSHILFTTDGLYRLMTLHHLGSDTIGFSLTVIDDEFIPQDAEHITANDGKVYFFKGGNIYTIPIQELLLKPLPPTIAHISLRTNTGYYDTCIPIHLSRSEAENIQLSIHSLSFDSRNLYYKYSLGQGVADNWNTTKNVNISLVALGYGDYRIKIKAVTESGAESEVYIINLTVMKPFYLQRWFLIVILLLLCIIIALITRSRIRYLLNKREGEHRLAMNVLKSEYKALNALMNPHFIFNSLNSIQGFINKGNKASANMYLHLFSKLIRQNMQNVSMDLVSLSAETELVKSYLLLEKMRFNDRFEYHIDIEEEIEETDIFIPPLLIQPLAENAIKHGLLPRYANDNTLWIRIHQQESWLIIEVEDNGVGLISGKKHASDSTHQSYALTNIHSRIAQLNRLYQDVIHMYIESEGSNMGTKIRLVVDTDRLNSKVNDRY